MAKQQALAFIAKVQGSRMDLDVYETIGESWWGDSITAKDVLARIREAKPSEAFMRVNSGGGDLFEAIAISNLLKASGAKVIVSIDGIAASAATHLWPVGSHVTMASNAMMMIHKAWTIALGNATEMTKQAETLSKADDMQASNYAQYAASRGVQVTAERFANLMAEETWMTAEEALAHGLIDTIGEAVAVAASIDVTPFRKAPAALVSRAAAAKSFTVPMAAPQPKENMDTETMQAAIKAKDAELATIKADLTAKTSELETVKAKLGTVEAELSDTKSRLETSEVQVQALTTQNSAIVAERDTALADIAARDTKLLENEVDALIPNVLDPAERDNFIALAKTSRSLFDSMVAQRKPRNLTAQIITTDIPPADSNTAVGADAKFDALVTKDIS